MGVIRDLILGRPQGITQQLERASAPGPLFATSIDPGVLYGMPSMDDVIRWYGGTTRISRQLAMSVPAVKRARDLIAGTLGMLPLRLHDPAGAVVDPPWSLLEQPEEHVPATVTWTNVVDDMLMAGRGWLRVTNLGWHNLPATVVRLDPDSVSVQPDTVTWLSATGSGTAQTWRPDPLLIRVDSPNDALLTAGARPIRSLLGLELAAMQAANGLPPNDYFTPAEGVDPADDDEITALLDAWIDARQQRRTGYVPAALEYHSNGFSPEQIQLNDARTIAITEIARLTGIDPEDLGVSTTSRTYQNSQDRRRAFLDFTVGPYMRAVEGALSQDTVTPHGYTVRFDTSRFAAADDYTTAQTDALLIDKGITTADAVARRRGLDPADTTNSTTREGNTNATARA